ncbi:dor1-like family protein [Hirsutella rhossiliensis]|uniref:Conserved oligomeric Golgi complex subunit 8 n=1 Tax=Hirsutella rhossiliensis TaxID=111463 RepID=A0A9P8MSV7_9HYPO|nr:dor1-like family domain-containing protein [Hirsutella rhossiliensis]KAH0960670.1 dor1-like family domain-containing protein [Hirsutella rhossiliensis]
MSEALGDLLGLGQTADATALAYLASLAEHPADTFRSSEPQRLAQASHSLLLSVQALSKRSHKPIVDSAAGHASLRRTLPVLGQRISELSQAVPRLDTAADAFSTTFGKTSESKTIARRKEALRLLHNAERLVDVMELPPLLTSAVNTIPVSHSSTLDLHAHVRRLASLYPRSPLVSSVLGEADAAIRQMATDLIVALKTPGLKLAAGLRTVGWLKRILPDLVPGVHSDDTLPALFLVCRLMTLLTTLAALEPLRELAVEERLRQAKSSSAWSGGQHTERYLKRFIEIFREHAFGIVSMSKNVDASFISSSSAGNNALDTPPSTLPTFPLHLVGLLLDTLRTYLPNVKDQTSRDSIIIQVLYCAGSLGRLGADFGLLLAALGVNEWADLVKRHRLLAGRLESVIGDYRGNQVTIPTASAPQPET